MPPNPACRSLTRQDFKIGLTNRLRGLSNRSIVVVGNYCSGPISAGTIPSKSAPFTPSSILFRPRRSPEISFQARALVEAPGTAPGSEWFITTAVYRHIRPCGRHSQYRPEGLTNKDPRPRITRLAASQLIVAGLEGASFRSRRRPPSCIIRAMATGSFSLVQLASHSQDAAGHSAMAAGLRPSLMSMADVVAMIDAAEAKALADKRRGLLDAN